LLLANLLLGSLQLRSRCALRVALEHLSEVGGFADHVQCVHPHGMAGGLDGCAAARGLQHTELRLELDHVAPERLESVANTLFLEPAVDGRKRLDGRQRRHRRRLLARCSCSFGHPVLLACSCR